MDFTENSYREKNNESERIRRRRFLLCLFLTAGLFGLSWESSLHSSSIPPVNPIEKKEIKTAVVKDNCAKHVRKSDIVFTHSIAADETLSTIFNTYQISQKVMYQILSADEALLALDVLRPGNTLTFAIDPETEELKSMELRIHPGKQVLYTRADKDTFDCEEIIIPGEWRQELLTGSISDSFYVSAQNANLTSTEIGNIINLFRAQIHFARDMRSGDRFQVIRSRHFVDGTFTGQSRIEAIRIFRGKRLYDAYLFEDGNYYDEHGKSLARAFRRYPMEGSYRISSHFNHRRRHPITGRIAAHNGVDFAMPTGTAVLSAGDGIITRVVNHPYAGKYVEIQHGSHYTTRYLHLSRIFVKRRQSVKRGDRIALSGNTGRSTGMHLHYELHINGRPVNPITAKIPVASAIPRKKTEEFNQCVEEALAVMKHASAAVALHRFDGQFWKNSFVF
ncbi:MAG: peptidoglycan DD-metalloendopeptidase family protein [Syntrophales bacterium]|jgi:murein DD-endopeptidase|nr:peptidoglycan DD-metalloendopeptidase family protein [Syntrophales bacterium]MDY0045275.1 peptidoglycan DD-metalloendopeptidase family protein [Syntrophales bacterium]